MLERQCETNRDVFDVWFFLKHNWSINKEIVFKRTEMEFKAFLQQCLKLLDKKSNRNILSGIGELLDGELKIWAKKHLKDDTIFLLKIRLSNEK